MKNVLVTYGSKFGSTAEIAEKIAEVLRTRGLNVSIMPASTVSDLSAFNAVVLGSAVYTGHWTKEATDFLVSHEDSLSTRPVWFFSSGPTGQGDPVERLHGWRFPDAQLDIADRIRPQGMVVFHGKIDIQNLNFGERLMIRAVGSPTGDFRDWTAITAWAEEIATTLLPLEMTVGKVES
jgi:menaquinone-dependent protoporphyrinogen oxidase